MPLYNYECQSCKKIADDIRLIANRNDPFKCPFCGGCGENVWVTKKSMRGNARRNSKHVNFQVDTKDVIYKKQIAIMANKPKPKNLTTGQWHHVLGKHMREANNTRPEKVA